MPVDPKIWEKAPDPASPEFVDWLFDTAWATKNVEMSQAILREGRSKRKAALYRQREKSAE